MTKLEGPSILLPLVIIIALAAAFLYRSQIANLLNPNSCQYTADLSITGLDNQLRPQSQSELTKLLSAHFEAGEEISAKFTEQDSKLLVEGGIRRTSKPETSELSKKLGADPATSVQVNTPAQAEASIRKVFANIKPGRFAIYLSESDPTVRGIAFTTLKERFPSLQLNSLETGPIAALPGLPHDVLRTLRSNPAAGPDHIFLVEFAYSKDVVANILLVHREPVMTSESVTRTEVVSDGFGISDQESFSLSLMFNDAGSTKLHEVTRTNVGGFLPFAVDTEAITVPTITGAISGGTARLSLGVSKADPSGEIGARRVLLSIDSGKKLKESLRIDLNNLKVTCE